jgi:integrase
MQQQTQNLKSLTRKNKKTYTLKDNPNRFFYPEEYMRFEDALKEKQKFSVRFLINTGARINEARNVKVSDIDFERKRLILRVTKTKAKKGEKGSGKPRIIPISTQFSRYLKKYIVTNRIKPESTLGILSNPALNIAYKKAAQKAKIKDWWNISSHTFRKTLEVWLLALGVDSLKLLAHFGHDVRTAASHYVSPDIFTYQEKKLMRQIIGDLYENG